MYNTLTFSYFLCMPCPYTFLRIITGEVATTLEELHSSLLEISRNFEGTSASSGDGVDINERMNHADNDYGDLSTLSGGSTSAVTESTVSTVVGATPTSTLKPRPMNNADNDYGDLSTLSGGSTSAVTESTESTVGATPTSTLQPRPMYHADNDYGDLSTHS